MRKVEVNRQIHCPPSRVIAAFTEADLLSEWWSVEKSFIEKKPGGSYVLTWLNTADGFGYVSAGVIASFDPESELVVGNFVYLNPSRPILGPMQLIVRVKPVEQGCALYLCQDGYQSGADWDWYFAAVQEAWPKMVDVLQEFLERK